MRKMKRFKYKKIAVLVATCIYGLSCYTLADIGKERAEQQKQKIVYTVRYGDTLWDIAKIENNGEDIRQTIMNIKERNNIGDYLEVNSQIELYKANEKR